MYVYLLLLQLVPVLLSGETKFSVVQAVHPVVPPTELAAEQVLVSNTGLTLSLLNLLYCGTHTVYCSHKVHLPICIQINTFNVLIARHMYIYSYSVGIFNLMHSGLLNRPS